MNILILGATGFIGSAIFHSLVADYQVITGGRRPVEGYQHWREVDFSKENDWEALLEGVDWVINAIGIIEGDFSRIQTVAPIEMYQKCKERKIKVIHISAIGAEKDNPPTLFLKSKKITDNFLLDYEQAKVVYPGIVLGRNGKSTQFFAEAVQFPIIPLFSEKPIPFVHISHLTELVQRILKDFDRFPTQVFSVSKPEPVRKVFSAIKWKKGKFIKIPEWVFSALFTVFPSASIGIFNKDTFKMFQSISVDDYPAQFPEVSKSIQANQLTRGNDFPKLFALLAISFIWIFSGLSSFISWDESYGLMKEIGANHSMAVLFIWLGSLADIFLGIAVLNKKYRKKMLVLQMLTMLVYMLILTIGAPHYWLHPFGVLTKNIPLIALSYYLYREG